jgi:hypothetical protein
VISIIKQIQASITGEAKWLRWVWSKCNGKTKYTIYTSKHQLLLKQRQIASSPSNQAIWVANIKFQTQGGSNQHTRFSMQKTILPPKPKVKHNKRQIQPKTRTPPEVENPRFYQISLYKSQDNHRPLKEQSKWKRIWPRHKSHKSKNNHQWSQAKPTRLP